MKRHHRKGLAVLALGFVLVLSACMSPEEQSAFDKVNATRRQVGSPQIVEWAAMSGPAQQWSQFMLNRSGNSCLLSHRTNILQGVPAGWWAAGENVGCATGASPGAAINSIHGAFLLSRDHKANM